MRVRTAFVIIPVLLGLAACCLAEPASRPAGAALPADRELAEWVQRGEGVFDLVLELWATARPYGRKGPIDAKKALALWKRIAPRLPKEDLLRQRICYTVAKVFEQSDPATAAKIAESCKYPSWSASLYRRAGKKDDERRMSDVAKQHARREEAFQKLMKRFTRREADLQDWLGKQPVMERIEFLTSGVAGPWARQCDKGFSHFVASLPKNVRLRRVMTLYYTPCGKCGLSPSDGELDLAEPILRTTAAALPDKLGRTYRLLVQAGMGESSWLTGPLRIPGDWGPTGNALRVTGELLRAAPGAKAEILAVARKWAEANKTPAQRCRWLALAAFLQDGAPDVRRDWETVLPKKLRGTEIQRRWALAWLPNELAEAPKKPLKFTTNHVPNAVAQAARKCATAEDKILACDAIGALPAPAGLEVAMAMASQDSPLQLWRMAVDALRRQYRRAGRRRGAAAGPPAPLPAFAALLPAFRKALYPRLSQRQETDFVLKFLAELRDPKLDAEVARHLLAKQFTGTRFMQYSASTGMIYKGMSWDRTISAFQALGQDKSFKQAKYAARLARDLLAAK